MPHVVVFLANVADCQTIKRAGVVRLPPASWIERGPVERDCTIANADHLGVELGEVCVAEIDQIGGHDFLAKSTMNSHCVSLTGMTLSRFAFCNRWNGPSWSAY
jgi:hypothetical protein